MFLSLLFVAAVIFCGVHFLKNLGFGPGGAGWWPWPASSQPTTTNTNTPVQPGEIRSDILYSFYAKEDKIWYRNEALAWTTFQELLRKAKSERQPIELIFQAAQITVGFKNLVIDEVKSADLLCRTVEISGSK